MRRVHRYALRTSRTLGSRPFEIYSERRRGYKTAEPILDEAAWEAPDPETRVPVRVAWREASVARGIKAAGRQWHRAYKLWSLPCGQVER